MADTNKRKKSAYYAKCGGKKARTQFTLQPGVRGFLATCNFREKDCIREATNILSECADRIYGEDKVRFSLNSRVGTHMSFDYFFIRLTFVTIISILQCMCFLSLLVSAMISFFVPEHNCRK